MVGTAGGSLFFGVASALAGPYDGAAGTDGSLAVAADDSRIKGWATAAKIVRGPVNALNPSQGFAAYGTAAEAIGPASVDSIYPVVSLGDGGSATVSFGWPMVNAPGPDFAVFENSFDGDFLELGFVEVSSNGRDFFRFPSVSLTQTNTQVGTFGTIDPTDISGLAGKYEVGYGAPFDLSSLDGLYPQLNVNFIVAVRVVDVVGSIDGVHSTYDSLGHKVNDPFTTPFSTGGFDLDAVALLSPFGGFVPVGVNVPTISVPPSSPSAGGLAVIPEPGSIAGIATAMVLCTRRRRTR